MRFVRFGPFADWRGNVHRIFRPAVLRLSAAGIFTVVALATAAASGPPATASGAPHIARQPGAPAHVHYLPVNGTSPGSIQGQLIYHNGPVMKDASNSYAIFWEPPKLQTGDPAYVDPQYNALIKQYFKDIGGTTLYNINTQYYQVVGGNQQHIKNVATLAGSWVDTAAYPASGCNDPYTPGNCLTDAQIQTEVSYAQKVNGWTAGPNNIFYVFTAKGEGSCFTQGGSCAFNTYCAYHGDFGATIYANMPYGTSKPHALRNSCTRAFYFPGNVDADIEATTDPHLNAWYDAGGQEIGDLCVYNYGTKDEDNGLANQKWNGHFYLMQMEWDNAVAACAQDGP
jgi:hypothetical protein